MFRWFFVFWKSRKKQKKGRLCGLYTQRAEFDIEILVGKVMSVRSCRESHAYYSSIRLVIHNRYLTIMGIHDQFYQTKV